MMKLLLKIGQRFLVKLGMPVTHIGLIPQFRFNMAIKRVLPLVMAPASAGYRARKSRLNHMMFMVEASNL